MIWIRNNTARIQPALDSLRQTLSIQQRRVTEQQDLQLQKTNWKVVACAVSLIVFMVLLLTTIIGIPVILTQVKKNSGCRQSKGPVKIPTFTGPPSTTVVRIGRNFKFLCSSRALWSVRGVTVAGLPSGSPSSAFSGLHHPSDIYVYGDGTLLVADSGNNRITKWRRDAKEGVLIAGTGSYGSWHNLLAKPLALTVRREQLYVSDVENYRIQMFDLDSNMTSPAGTTLIGRYGQGSDLTQINRVTGLVASDTSPSLLYMSDAKNHRILSWNSELQSTAIVIGPTDRFESNSSLLNSPTGITLDPEANTLYLADTFNNRIQKYNLNSNEAAVTVAGWGQLHHPKAVQLDPSGANLLIADTLNHRILVWVNGASQGRVIAGNGVAGKSDTQLDSPSQIRFDADYNLYVADTNNCRVQRFDLLSNGC